jgi:hypothetical protein
MHNMIVWPGIHSRLFITKLFSFELIRTPNKDVFTASLIFAGTKLVGDNKMVQLAFNIPSYTAYMGHRYKRTSHKA